MAQNFLRYNIIVIFQDIIILINNDLNINITVYIIH